MYTRLYLIRHGQVAEEWHGRVYGCLDVPLSALGERQSERAARRLAGTRLSGLVHSGLRRSEHGARCLAETVSLADGPCADPDLREIDRGSWAGLSFEELEREHPGQWDAWRRAPARRRPPRGESLEDLATRVLPRLDRWARSAAVGDPEHGGAAVALVLHLWVIRVAVCAATGLALDEAPRLALPTGGQVVLDWPTERSPAQWSGAWTMGERAPVPRPTLVGFASEEPPSSDRPWFRGPPQPAD